MFSMSFRKPIVVCLYVWVVNALSYSVSTIFSIGFDAFLLYSPSTARASFWNFASSYLQALEAIGLDLDDLGQRRLAGEDVIHGQVVGGVRVRVRAHLLDDGGVLVGRVVHAAAEHQVLEEVREAGLARFDLVAAARADDRVEGDQARGVEADDVDLEPVGQRPLRDRKRERQPAARGRCRGGRRRGGLAGAGASGGGGGGGGAAARLASMVSSGSISAAQCGNAGNIGERKAHRTSVRMMAKGT